VELAEHELTSAKPMGEARESDLTPDLIRTFPLFFLFFRAWILLGSWLKILYS
jgi:hypothetical protein